MEVENSREDYYARRGQDMYENIEALVEDDSKVIVHMHNAHATKQLGEAGSHVEILDLMYNALENSVGSRLEDSDINTFHIATIFNEGENIFPDENFYREDTLPRKTRNNDLENRISEYRLDHAFVNLHETDWADEELSTYYEGHPAWGAPWSLLNSMMASYILITLKSRLMKHFKLITNRTPNLLR